MKIARAADAKCAARAGLTTSMAVAARPRVNRIAGVTQQVLTAPPEFDLT
jgi:hypothetical protein